MKPDKLNGDKKVTSKRKIDMFMGNNSIYYFNSLENYYQFENFIKLHNAPLLAKLKENSRVYFLYENYFLIIESFNLEDHEHAFFCSTITEFAKFMNNSKALISKILENAKLIDTEQKRTLIAFTLFITFLSPRLCSPAKIAKQFSVESIYIIGSLENFPII